MSDTETKPTTCKVLSIDAWRYDEGWNWNQWWDVGEVPVEFLDWSTRKQLAYFRKHGYLSAKSAGKVAIEDDQYNLVIVEKGNRRPVFAVEYGNLY